MPILQGIEDSVSNSNFKYKGELSLDQVSLQRDEAIAHWSSMNKAREGFMVRALQNFAEDNSARSVGAMSDSQILTGNRVAQDGVNAALVAALAQIVSKSGDNTPPQTGTQKV